MILRFCFRFVGCNLSILFILFPVYAVSTKRSHECWTSSGGGGEQIHRQASSSPVRTSVATVLTTPAPASPSSNFSVRKKMVSYFLCSFS